MSRNRLDDSHSWCAHDPRFVQLGQMKSHMTWHYTFAKITPLRERYQWVTTHIPAATVEDQSDAVRPALKFERYMIAKE